MRFAILHHTGIPSPHFDLLIETGPDALLLTFRLEHWPITAPAPADITRQADHRRVYLEYEGPISGNRGEVRRIASGECICSTLTASIIDLTLQLATPIRLHLTHVQADQWRCTML